jgi:PmbA protein
MLIVKEKGSSNIMDMGFGFQAQKYNREEILKNAKKLCDAYKKPIESFEDGIYPVVFIQEDYLIKMKFFKDLNALIYGSGGSIFTEKIGEKLFSENFNLIQSKNIEDGYLGAFFDVEGTINKNYKYNLIENGVLKTPFTNKKYSKMFNLPLTGAASGSFDSTPDLGFTNLIIQDTGKSIKELLNGQKAIFVLISSGGDYTPDGKFGAPVQASFLFDGENYLGKLPELNLSSHLYDMYGKDFVGVSNDNLFSFARSNLAVMNMKVSKI